MHRIADAGEGEHQNAEPRHRGRPVLSGRLRIMEEWREAFLFLLATRLGSVGSQARSSRHRLTRPILLHCSFLRTPRGPRFIFMPNIIRRNRRNKYPQERREPHCLKTFLPRQAVPHGSLLPHPHFQSSSSRHMRRNRGEA